MRPTPGVYLESIEVHDQTIDIWDILDPYKDSSRIIERGDGSPFLFWKYLDNGWISLNNLLTCCHRGVYINTYGRIIIFPSGVVTTRVIDSDIQTILCENGIEYVIDEDGNKLSIISREETTENVNCAEVEYSQKENTRSIPSSGILSGLFTVHKKSEATELVERMLGRFKTDGDEHEIDKK